MRFLIKKSFIAWLFLLILSNQLAGQTDSFVTILEEHLASFPKYGEVAVGIIDQDVIYKLGYINGEAGLKEINNHQTLFEIGSITKTFTIALLMKEIRSGNISLNDPLQKHLNFSIQSDTYQDSTLKIRHLITHTSGLKARPL
ncbi:MAG: serine hydrolase domain-containing protein, partial [Bacteroidota bacterium]